MGRNSKNKGRKPAPEQGLKGAASLAAPSASGNVATPPPRPARTAKHKIRKFPPQATATTSTKVDENLKDRGMKEQAPQTLKQKEVPSCPSTISTDESRRTSMATLTDSALATGSTYNRGMPAKTKTLEDSSDTSSASSSETDIRVQNDSCIAHTRDGSEILRYQQTSPAQEMNVIGGQDDSFLWNAKPNGATQSSSEDGAASLNRSVDSCISPDSMKQKNVKEQEIQNALNKEPDKGQTTTGQNNPPHIGEGLKRARNASVPLILLSAPSCDAVPQSLENADLLKEAHEETSQVAEKVTMISQPERNEYKPPQEMGPPGEDQQTSFLHKAMQSPGKERPDVDLQEEIPDEISSLEEKVSTEGIPDKIAGSFMLDKCEISLQGSKMEKSDVKCSEITKEPLHDNKERQEQEFDQLEKAYVAENFTKSFVEHDMENLKADGGGIILDKICGKWMYDQPDSASVCEKQETTNCLEDMPETFNAGEPKSVKASQMEDPNLEGDTEHQKDRNQDNEADKVIGFSLNEQFITDSSERSMDNLEMSERWVSLQHSKQEKDQPAKADHNISVSEEQGPQSVASELNSFGLQEPKTGLDSCDDKECQEIWAFHPKDDFRDSLVHEVNNCSPHEQLIADSADTDLESHDVAEEQKDHNSSACKEQALPAVGHYLELIQLADTESDIVKSDKPECEEAIAHHSKNETTEGQGKVVNHCSPTDQFITDSMGKEGIQVCETQVDLSNPVCEEKALQSALANLKPLDLGKPEMHVEEMKYQETAATSPYNKTGAGLGGNFLVNFPNEQLLETKSVENSLESLDIGETQEDNTNPICKEQASQSVTSKNLFEQEASAPSIAVCDDRRCKEDIELQTELQTKDEIMESQDKGVRQLFPEEQINTYSAQKDLKKLESSEAPLDCASSVLKEQTQQFASEFRLHELSNLNEQVLACEKGDHRETPDETKEGQCYKATDSFLIEHVITDSSEKDLKEEDVGEAQVNPRDFICDDQVPPSAACEQKLVQQEEAQDTRESQEGAALQPEETREYKGDQVNKPSLLEERLEVGKVHQTSSSCEDQAPALSDLKPAEQEQTQSEAECQGFTLHPADEHIEGIVDQASDCSSHETLLTDFVARDLKCLDMPEVHIDHNSSAREEQAQPSVAHESLFFQAQIVCEKTECQEVSAIDPYEDAKEGQDDDARDFPMSEQLSICSTAKDTKSLQVGDAQVDLRSPVLEDQPFQFVPANLELHELETPAKDIENKENQEDDATFQKDETEGKDDEVIDLSSNHQPTVTSMENNTERHDMDETRVDSICPIIEEQAPQFVTNSKVMLDELERECQNGAVFQPEQTREYEGDEGKVDEAGNCSPHETLVKDSADRDLESLDVAEACIDHTTSACEEQAQASVVHESLFSQLEQPEREVVSQKKECQEIAALHPNDDAKNGQDHEARDVYQSQQFIMDSTQKDTQSLQVGDAQVDLLNLVGENQQSQIASVNLKPHEMETADTDFDKRESQEAAATGLKDETGGKDDKVIDSSLDYQPTIISIKSDKERLDTDETKRDNTSPICEEQASQSTTSKPVLSELEDPHEITDCQEGAVLQTMETREYKGDEANRSFLQEQLLKDIAGTSLDQAPSSRELKLAEEDEMESEAEHQGITLHPADEPMNGEVDKVSDCSPHEMLVTDSAPIDLKSLDAPEVHIDHNSSACEEQVQPSVVFQRQTACEEKEYQVLQPNHAIKEKEYQVLQPNHAIKEDQDDAARDFSLYSTGTHTESPQDSDAHVDCSLVWEDQSSQFAPGNLKSHELETSEKYFENQENQEDVATCPKDETGGKDDKVIDSSSNDQPIISIKKDKEKLDMDATQVDKASPICEEQASQSMTTTLVLDGLEEAQDTRECHEAVVLQPEETNDYKGDRANRTLLQEQPLTDEVGKYLKRLEAGEVQEDQTSCPHDDRAPPSSGLKAAEQEETHPEAECQEATLHLADKPIDLENRENQEAVATSLKDETESKDDKVVSSSNDPPIITSMEKDKERLDMAETQADTTSLICEERAPQSMTSKLVLDELKEAQDKRECHNEGAVLQPEETKEYKDDGANSSSLQEQILTNMVGKSLKRLEVGEVQEDQTSCPRDDRAPPSSVLEQAEQEETEAAAKCQEVTLHPMDFEDGENQEGAATSPKDETEGKDDKVIASSSNDQQIIVSMGKDKERIGMDETKADNTTNIYEEQESQSTTSKTMLDELEEAQDTTECHECAVVRPEETGENKCVKANESCLQEHFLKDIMEKFLDQAPPSSELKLAEQGKMESEAECQEVTLHPADECIECKVDEVAHTGFACQEQAQPSEPESSLVQREIVCEKKECQELLALHPDCDAGKDDEDRDTSLPNQLITESTVKDNEPLQVSDAPEDLTRLVWLDQQSHIAPTDLKPHELETPHTDLENKETQEDVATSLKDETGGKDDNVIDSSSNNQPNIFMEEDKERLDMDETQVDNTSPICEERAPQFLAGEPVLHELEEAQDTRECHEDAVLQPEETKEGDNANESPLQEQLLTGIMGTSLERHGVGEVQEDQTSSSCDNLSPPLSQLKTMEQERAESEEECQDLTLHPADEPIEDKVGEASDCSSPTTLIINPGALDLKSFDAAEVRIDHTSPPCQEQAQPSAPSESLFFQREIVLEKNECQEAAAIHPNGDAKEGQNNEDKDLFSPEQLITDSPTTGEMSDAWRRVTLHTEDEFIEGEVDKVSNCSLSVAEVQIDQPSSAFDEQAQSVTSKPALDELEEPQAEPSTVVCDKDECTSSVQKEQAEQLASRLMLQDLAQQQEDEVSTCGKGNQTETVTLLPIETKQGQDYEASDLFLHNDVITGSLEKDLEREEVGEPQVDAKCFTCDDGEPQFAASEPKLVEQDEPEVEEGKGIGKYQEGTVFQPKETKECEGDKVNEASLNKQLLTDCMENSLERLENGEVQVDQTSYSCEDQAPPSSELKSAEQKETETKATGEIRECQIITLNPADEPKEGKADKASDCSHNVVEIQVDYTSPACEEQAQPVVVGESLPFQPEQRQRDIVCEKKEGQEVITLHFNGDDSEGQDNNARDFYLPGQLITDSTVKGTESLQIHDEKEDLKSLVRENQPAEFATANLKTHELMETSETDIEDRENEAAVATSPKDETADKDDEVLDSEKDLMGERMGEMQVGPKIFICDGHVPPSGVSAQKLVEQEEPETEEVQSTKERKEDAICQPEKTDEQICDNADKPSLKEQLLTGCMEKSLEKLEVVDVPVDQTSCAQEEQAPPSNALKLAEHKETETKATGELGECQGFAFHPADEQIEGKAYKAANYFPDVAEVQVDQTSAACEKQAQPSVVSEPLFFQLEQLDREIVCEKKEYQEAAALCPNVVAKEGQTDETRDFSPTEQLIANPAEENTENLQVSDALDHTSRVWEDQPSQFAPMNFKPHELETPDTDLEKKGNQAVASSLKDETGGKDDEIIDSCSNDQPIIISMKKDKESLDMDEKHVDNTSPILENQAPQTMMSEPVLDELEEPEPEPEKSNVVCDERDYKCSLQEEQAQQFASESKFRALAQLEEEVCICEEGDRRETETLLPDRTKESQGYEASDSSQKDLEGEEWDEPVVDPESSTSDSQVPPSEPKLVEQEEPEAEEAQYMKESQEGAVLQPAEDAHNGYDKAYKFSLQEQLLTGCTGTSSERFEVGEVQENQTSCTGEGQAPPSSESIPSAQEETETGATGYIRECQGATFLLTNELKEDKADEASNCFPHETLVTESACIDSRSLDVAEVQEEHRSSAYEEQTQPSIHLKSFACEDQVPPSAANEWKLVEQKQVEAEEAQDKKECQEGAVLQPEETDEYIGEKADNIFLQEQFLMEGLQVGEVMVDQASYSCKDQILPSGELKLEEQKETQEKTTSEIGDCLEVILPAHKHKESKIDKASHFSPDEAEVQVYHTSATRGEQAESLVICEPSSFWLEHSKKEIEIDEKKCQDDNALHPNGAAKEGQDDRAGDFFTPEQLIIDSAVKGMESLQVSAAQEDLASIVSEDQLFHFASGNLKTRALETPGRDVENRETEEAFESRENQEAIATGPMDEIEGKHDKLIDSSSNDQPFTISMENDKERLDMDETQMDNTSSICAEQAPKSATSKQALDELQEPQPSTIVCDERDCISSLQEEQAEQFASEIKVHNLTQPEEEVFVCEKGGQREIETLLTDAVKESQGCKSSDSFLNEHVITASSEKDLGEDIGEAQVDWKSFTCDDQVPPSAGSEPNLVELEDSETEAPEYANECQQGAVVHHSSSNDQPVTISMEKDKKRLDMDEIQMDNTSCICEEQAPQSVTSKLTLDELQEPQPSKVLCDERDCISFVQEEQAQQFASELKHHDLAQPEEEVSVCEKGGHGEIEKLLPDEMKESQDYKADESFLNEDVITASAAKDLEGEEVGEVHVDWKSFTCDDQVPPAAASEPTLVELEDSEAEEAEYAKECQRSAVVHDSSSNDQPVPISIEKDKERLDMDKTKMEKTRSICEEQGPQSATSKLALDELQEPQPSTVVSDERDCISSVQEEQAQQFASESKFHKLAQPEEEVFVCEKGGQREIETHSTDQMKESQGYKASDSFLNENVITASSENDLEGEEVGEAQIDWKGFTLNDQVLPSAASEPKLVELGDSEAEEAEYAKECQQGAVVDHSSSNDQPLTIFMEKDKERLDMDETHTENTSSICEEQVPQSVTSKPALDELQEPQPSTVFCDERDCMIHNLAQLKEEVFVCEKGGDREIETVFPDEMKESQDYKAVDSILNEHVITASSEKALEGEDVGEAQVDWKSFTCDDQVPPSAASEPTLVELEDSEVEGAENAKECHSSSNDQPVTISMEKNKERLEMDETHMENTSSICEEQTPQSVTSKLALDELQEPQPSTVVCDERDCISPVQEEQAQQFARELNLHDLARPEKEVFVCEKGGQRENETPLPDEMKEREGCKASDSFLNEHVIPASSKKDLEGEEVSEAQVDWISFTCNDQVPPSAASEPRLVELEDSEAEEAEYTKECQQGAVDHNSSSNDQPFAISTKKDKERIDMDETQTDNTSSICEEEAPKSATSKLALDEFQEPQPTTVVSDERDCITSVQEQEQQFASELKPHELAEPEEEVFVCEKEGQKKIETLLPGAMKESQGYKAGDSFLNEQVITSSSENDLEGEKVGETQVDWKSFTCDYQVPPSAASEPKLVELEDSEAEAPEYAKECQKDAAVHHSSSNDQPVTISIEKDEERLDMDETQIENTSSICEEQAPQSVTHKVALHELQEPQPNTVVCDEGDCISSVQEEQAQQFASESKLHNLAGPEKEVFVCEKGGRDEMKESQDYKAGDSFLNEQVITASSEKDLEGEEVGEAQVDWKSFTSDDQVPPSAASEPTLVEPENSETEEAKYAKECQQGAGVHDSSSNDRPCTTISMEKDKERLDINEAQMDNTSSICEEQAPKSATSELALDELQEPQPSTVVSVGRDCITSVQDDQAQQFASELKLHELTQPEEEVFVCEKVGQRKIETLLPDAMKESQGYKAGDSFLNEHVITASSEKDLEGEEVGEAVVDLESFTNDYQAPPSAAREPKLAELEDSEAEEPEYAKECQQGAVVHDSLSNDPPVIISMEKDKERLDMDKTQMDNTSSICEEHAPQSGISKLALDELHEPQPSTAVCDERDCISSVQEEQAHQFASELKLHDLAQSEEEVFVCEKGVQREIETLLTDRMKESQSSKAGDSFLNEHSITAFSEKNLKEEEVGEAQVDWKSFISDDQVPPSVASEPKLVELEDSEAEAAEYAKKCQQGAVVHQSSSNDQPDTISMEKDMERLDMDKTPMDNTSSVCDVQVPQFVTSKQELAEPQQPQPSTVACDERDCITSLQEEQAQKFASESKLHELTQPEEESFACEKGGQREIETLLPDTEKESQGYKSSDSFLNEHVITASSEKDLEGEEVGEAQVDWKSFTCDDQVPPSAASEPKLVELEDSEAEVPEYAEDCQQCAVVHDPSSNNQPIIISVEKDNERLDMDETQMDNTSSICEEQVPQSMTSKVALDELQEPHPSTVVCGERDCISSVQDEQAQQLASELKLHDLAQPEEEVFVCEQGGQREIETLLTDQMKESQNYKASDSFLNEHVITASSENNLKAEEADEAQVDWKSFTCDDQVPPSAASEPKLVELEDSEAEAAEYAKECQQGAVVCHSSSNDQSVTISTEKDMEGLDMDKIQMDNTNSICEEQAPQSNTSKLALDELQEPQPSTVVCDERDGSNSLQEEQAQQFANELKLHRLAQEEESVCDKGGQREIETLLTDQMKESQGYKASDSFLNEHVITASSEKHLEGEEVGEAQVDWESFTCDDQVPSSAASEPKLVELEDSEAEEAEYTKECQQVAVVYPEENKENKGDNVIESFHQEQLLTDCTEGLEIGEVQENQTICACEDQAPPSSEVKIAGQEETETGGDIRECQGLTFHPADEPIEDKVDKASDSFPHETLVTDSAGMDLKSLEEQPQKEIAGETEESKGIIALHPFSDAKEGRGDDARNFSLPEQLITDSTGKDRENLQVSDEQVDLMSIVLEEKLSQLAPANSKPHELDTPEVENRENQEAVATNLKDDTEGKYDKVICSSSNDDPNIISMGEYKDRLGMDEAQVDTTSPKCEEQALQSAGCKLVLNELKEPSTVVCDERKSRETIALHLEDGTVESQAYQASLSSPNEQIITYSDEKDWDRFKLLETRLDQTSCVQEEQAPQFAASKLKLHEELGDPEDKVIAYNEREPEQALQMAETKEGLDGEAHGFFLNKNPITDSAEDRESVVAEAHISNDSSASKSLIITDSMGNDTDRLEMDKAKLDSTSPVSEEPPLQSPSSTDTDIDDKECQETAAFSPKDEAEEGKGDSTGVSSTNEQLITSSVAKDLERLAFSGEHIDNNIFNIEKQALQTVAIDLERFELHQAQGDCASSVNEEQSPPFAANDLKLHESEEPKEEIKYEERESREAANTLHQDETERRQNYEANDSSASENLIMESVGKNLGLEINVEVNEKQVNHISTLSAEQSPSHAASELKLAEPEKEEVEAMCEARACQEAIPHCPKDELKEDECDLISDLSPDKLVTDSLGTDLESLEVAEAHVDHNSSECEKQAIPSVIIEFKLHQEAIALHPSEIKEQQGDNIKDFSLLEQLAMDSLKYDSKKLQEGDKQEEAFAHAEMASKHVQPQRLEGELAHDESDCQEDVAVLVGNQIQEGQASKVDDNSSPQENFIIDSGDQKDTIHVNLQLLEITARIDPPVSEHDQQTLHVVMVANDLSHQLNVAKEHDDVHNLKILEVEAEGYTNKDPPIISVDQMKNFHLLPDAKTKPQGDTQQLHEEFTSLPPSTTISPS